MINKMLDRSKKPQPSEEIPFVLPELNRLRLSNGLEVFFIQFDKLPIVQMYMVTKAGSKFDPKGKSGLSQLFTSLLDEGADEYDSLALNEEFEMLGSVLTSFADQEFVFVSLLTLTENLERSVELFGKVITKPRFDITDFNREKDKALVRILQAQDDPAYLASINFEKIIFGDNHPYGFPEIGLNETVSSITLNDVTEFYKNNFLADNSSLVVVGNIDKDILISNLENRLEVWSTGEQKKPGFPKPVLSTNKIYIIDKEDSPQTEIRIGHLTSNRNNPEFFPKYLVNQILGGQFNSRLNMNLREKNGFTYGINSAFNYNIEASYFYITCAVDTENTFAAVREILDELKRIKKDISADELDFVKTSVIRKFPSTFETYSKAARNYLTIVEYGLPENYLSTYIDNIKAVQLDEVLNAANKYLSDAYLTILLVGDKEKLLSQLKQVDGFEITELDINGNPI
ncbi:MAG: insulinase family protein [Ignavibacteriales bacterium]|nr:MAG: insulinase family protein [Ignavibacteriales bacterium]